MIDDGAEARDLYRAFFELYGFDVEAAEDGPSGLGAALNVQPDAIVLDYSMPNMDGGEVLRKLKLDARTRDIPVVMLTAAPDLVSALTRAACSAFLEKPCEPDKLMRTIDEVTRNSRRTRPPGPRA